MRNSSPGHQPWINVLQFYDSLQFYITLRSVTPSDHLMPEQLSLQQEIPSAWLHPNESSEGGGNSHVGLWGKKKKRASVDNIGGILAVNKWGREWGMRRGRKGDSFIATADCSWSQNKAHSSHCRLAL